MKRIDKRVAATLNFKSEELLYDIKNNAFVEGDIIDTDNEHIRHQIIDIGEEGNIDRVARMLNLAHSECVEMLFPYTKGQIQEPADMDNTSTLPEVFSITMALPEGFSQTTLELLKNLIHEYIVCRVMSDWLKTVAAPKSSAWEERLYLAKQKIQTSLMSRTGMIRRKMKPF